MRMIVNCASSGQIKRRNLTPTVTETFFNPRLFCKQLFLL